jgi:hypothetical protein
MTRLEKWTQVAEIVAAAGVIITLVLLIQEVRTNTRAVQEQSRAQFTAAISEPFLSPDVLPGLYAKVKAVDSLALDPEVVAFVDRYDMTPAEAIQWTRLLFLQWSQWEARFEREGPSEELANWIRRIMAAPDFELYARTIDWPGGGPFAEYVARVTSN